MSRNLLVSKLLTALFFTLNLSVLANIEIGNPVNITE